MQLLEALKGHAEFAGTEYTLDATIGRYAVIYTYESLERGTYTYIEYFDDQECAEIDVEDGRDTARRNRRKAKTRTAEEMRELEGGDWISAIKLGKP